MKVFPVVRVALLAVLLSVAVAAAAWQAPQLKGTGVVSGRVVDPASGQPVRGAVVSFGLMADHSAVVPMDNPVAVAMFPGFGNYGKSAETGADGSFEFIGVPAGRFEIRASRLGAPTYNTPYNYPEEGRRFFELRDGEQRRGMEIRTADWPTLSGRVVDQRGSPLANIPIVAVPPGMSPDSVRDGAISDTTDDRGRFLLSVPAGEYIVGTKQFPSETDGAGPSSAYFRQFYPGVESIAQATRIRAVTGKEQSGIDFVLKTARAFRISGVIKGLPANRRAFFELLNPLDPRADALAFGSQSTSFSWAGVLPGQHLVRVTVLPNMPIGSHGVPALRELPPETTLWARAPVTVTDRDISLDLELVPGPRVNGRVEFDVNRPPAALDLMPSLIIDRADSSRTDYRGVYLDGGRFTTIQVEPARYVILAWPPKDWRLKSVMSGGRDVRDYPLEVGNADVNDVVITFTDRRSSVAGRVIREGQFEWVRGWVTIFPFDRALWSDYGNSPRRIVFVEPGSAGNFEADLPPGSYLIAATPNSTRGRITAETLTALAAIAVPVTIGDGQTARQDVRIQALRR